MKSHTKLKTIWLIILLCLTREMHAQNFSWAKSFGGNASTNTVGWASCSDESGNAYSAGSFYGLTDFDPSPSTYNLSAFGDGGVYISKLDPLGNFLWAGAFSGTGLIECWAIAVDPVNGSVYITGDFEDTADFDPGPAAFNMIATGLFDIFIVKLDSNGNFIWAKDMGGTDYASANSIVVDTSSRGSIYATGWYMGMCDFNPDTLSQYNLTSSGMADIFILKLDSSGNFLWAKSFGGPSDDAGQAIAVSNSGNGNIYFTGNFFDSVDFDPGPSIYYLNAPINSETYILKTDSLGNFLWAKKLEGIVNSVTLGKSGPDVIYSTGLYDGPADFDPDSGTFILPTYGLFISKLSENGSFVWAKGIEIESECVGCYYSIAADPDNNIYIGGSFDGSFDFDPGINTHNLTSVFEDAFLLKLESTGNFSWVKQMSGSETEIIGSVSINRLGNLTTTGWWESPTIPFDSITLYNASTTNYAFCARLNLSATTDHFEIENMDNGITIFPNPASHYIMIDIPASVKGDIIVTDMTGKIMSSIFTGDKREISADISDYADGLYLIRMNSGESIITSKLMITGNR